MNNIYIKNQETGDKIGEVKSVTIPAKYEYIIFHGVTYYINEITSNYDINVNEAIKGESEALIIVEVTKEEN